MKLTIKAGNVTVELTIDNDAEQEESEDLPFGFSVVSDTQVESSG